MAYRAGTEIRRTTMYVPGGILSGLDEMAGILGVSRTVIVLRALRNYLALDSEKRIEIASIRHETDPAPSTFIRPKETADEREPSMFD